MKNINYLYVGLKGSLDMSLVFGGLELPGSQRKKGDIVCYCSTEENAPVLQGKSFFFLLLLALKEMPYTRLSIEDLGGICPSP